MGDFWRNHQVLGRLVCAHLKNLETRAPKDCRNGAAVTVVRRSAHDHLSRHGAAGHDHIDIQTFFAVETQSLRNQIRNQRLTG